MNNPSLNNNKINTPINIAQVSNTFLGRASLHKTSIFKLFLLIVYTAIIAYSLVNDPYKIVTNYSSVFIFFMLLTALWMFYLNLRFKSNYIDFNFDIFKYFIILGCFIFIAFFFYFYNPGGLLMQYVYFPIYFFIVTLGIFIFISLILYIFSSKIAKSSLVDDKSPDFINLNKNETAISTIFKYFVLVALFICVISIIVIYCISTIASFKSSNYTNFVINIIIIIVIAAIIFRALTNTLFYQESPLLQLIINSIFYIPCLLIALIDNIVKLFSGDAGKTVVNGKTVAKSAPIPKPSTTDYILLIIAIILNVVYFAYPYAISQFSKQGGVLLINKPIYINKQTVLSSYKGLNQTVSPYYQSLNGNLQYVYNYAISFWVFLDASSPSTSKAYNTYTSILNYGGKPNIMYRGVDNTLMITMDNTGKPNGESKPTIPYEIDDNGNRIIYIKKNVLLQKWNNIIINYNGGTLDVFLNGDLVKSTIEVVSYMTYDELAVGSDNGINGGICNLNYFGKSLDINQIYYLYNFVKNNSPPVYTNTEDTIMSKLQS